MVDVLGHVAIGLLFAVPAWFLWDGRISLAFVAFVVSTSLLPDIDLYLRAYLRGIHHHGVTHTILFVVVFGLVVGALVTVIVDNLIQRWWAETESGWLTPPEIFTFVAGGFILGGLSHLFADMLSAPDISEPIEPFWPVFDKPISIDVVYYTDPTVNLGLFLVAAMLHLLLAYGDVGPTRFSRPGDEPG